MFVFVLACTSETVDSSPPEIEPVDTAPVWERPDPDWTAEQVAEQLSVGLADGVPSPHPLQKVYADLMAQGDEVCPGHPEQLSNARQGIGGCTAESGVYYEGISSYGMGSEAVAATQGDGNYSETSWFLSGDFLIVDADGERFVYGGQSKYVVLQTQTESRWNIEVAGTFRYEPSDAWIADIASNRVYVSGVLPSDGPPETKIKGGISNGLVDVYLEDLLFGADGCAGPPVSGVISIRGESGGWYRLELESDCTGCGAVVFDDRVDLGEVCVDLDSFRARTESMRPLEEG